MSSKSVSESSKAKPTVNRYLTALSKLGYTKTLTQKRIALGRNFSKCLTKVQERNWHAGLQIYLVGSRGEGMAVGVGNDFDCVCAQPAVKCFETRELEGTIKDADCAAAKFELDFKNSPEGYAQLRFMSLKEGDKYIGELLRRIDGALVDRTGTKYLRNDHRLIEAVEHDDKQVTREGIVSAGYEFSDKTGPSSPYHLHIFDISVDVDHVPSFSCYYPSAITAWSTNKASLKWPSKETIENVKASEVLVVPTGEPNINNIFNWRVSFTLAEQALVHSFDDTQIKVYAVLKMLSKHHLKPKCSAITSYIVKNILFWASEQIQLSNQAERDFENLLSQALTMMRKGICDVYLKNYMLPQRNLFKDRITDTERESALECLDAMIQDGPHVVLRCPLVKECVSDLQENEAELEKKLKIRSVLDEVVYSAMALSPDEYNDVEHKLHTATSIEEIIDEYNNTMFSYVKANNPFDYFSHIKDMTLYEISISFREGIKTQLDDWLNVNLNDMQRECTVNQLSDIIRGLEQNVQEK